MTFDVKNKKGIRRQQKWQALKGSPHKPFLLKNDNIYDLFL